MLRGLIAFGALSTSPLPYVESSDPTSGTGFRRVVQFEMPDADDVNTVSVRCFHNGEREPAISDSLQPSLISEMTWSRTKSMPTKLPDVLGLPIEVELKSRHAPPRRFTIVTPPWLGRSIRQADTVDGFRRRNASATVACNMLVLDSTASAILMARRRSGSGIGGCGLPRGEMLLHDRNLKECMNWEMKGETGMA